MMMPLRFGRREERTLFMPHTLSASEQLTYSTVRVACELANGDLSTGTGFFYAFYESGAQSVPAIVTNKHVVAGARKGRFSLTLKGPDDGPIVDQHVSIELDRFADRWIHHPDPAVDLCVMPIAPLLIEAQAQQRNFFFVSLNGALLPSDQELRDLTALEEVVMIGYPNGIWDATNNMPILRRGITATHAALNYEGRKEFMIRRRLLPRL